MNDLRKQVFDLRPRRAFIDADGVLEVLVTVVAAVAAVAAVTVVAAVAAVVPRFLIFYMTLLQCFLLCIFISKGSTLFTTTYLLLCLFDITFTPSVMTLPKNHEITTLPPHHHKITTPPRPHR